MFDIADTDEFTVKLTGRDWRDIETAITEANVIRHNRWQTVHYKLLAELHWVGFE